METLNKTVGQIVRENYRAAEIFEKYGIDFCCAGKKPLETSCSEKGIRKETVIEELLKLPDSAADEITTNFNCVSLTKLTEHIINTHHKYIEATGPVIIKYLDKVESVHGKHNPELKEINELFKTILGELVMHMRKEELMLFPYIKRLETTGRGSDSFTFGSIRNPIHLLMSEHESEGDKFKRISELTKQYTPPTHACNTFRVCYAKLQEFEKDLHLHIHLENNILFPKAIEIEEGKM